VFGRKFRRARPIKRDVIRLHRLGQSGEPFHLNPDLVLMVEATPDTVVSLTIGTKVLVAERPEEVVEAIRAWRASVLAASLGGRSRSPRRNELKLVRLASTDATPPHPEER
jgi:uncharacterized protein YlzI (FlbEa/FlbD family)